ncbi:putative holin-like toxin [Lederbergia wuyishanensis]|uniref:Holin-like toxin n=1 Tax=Lederbergia wuyishanensis TaxID=1347903 RepID=A0ABU0D8C6_9BACI|nr:putative holin-like toxin [Lederbergia citri]MDQ0344671.1 hypothetical protein [Lederbergia wuyishanensis]
MTIFESMSLMIQLCVGMITFLTFIVTMVVMISKKK